MGFILSILALALFSLAYLVYYIFSMVYNVKGRKWLKYTSKKHYSNALKIDVFGNWLLPDLWNFLFSKNGENYKFGTFGETLSSCFGKKQLEKSLSWFGWFVLVIINIVDFTKWFKRGHCIASIMTDEQIDKMFEI